MSPSTRSALVAWPRTTTPDPQAPFSHASCLCYLSKALLTSTQFRRIFQVHQDVTERTGQRGRAGRKEARWIVHRTFQWAAQFEPLYQQLGSRTNGLAPKSAAPRAHRDG